jgi:hypothetical protein
VVSAVKFGASELIRKDMASPLLIFAPLFSPAARDRGKVTTTRNRPSGRRAS